jgi:hypothetical protein
MKKQKLMTTRRIIFALILAGIIVIPTATLRAQTIDEQTTEQTASFGGILDILDQIRQAQAQRLEGSWVVTITPAVPPGVPQPPSFRAYATFARGGALIGTDTRRLFNIQHGAWKHLGGNEFAFTVIEELVDVMGNFAGTVKIRVKLTVTGANEWVGVSSAEERNAAGGLVTIRCGTVRAARITVEPLPQQCQSITPPQ